MPLKASHLALAPGSLQFLPSAPLVSRSTRTWSSCRRRFSSCRMHGSAVCSNRTTSAWACFKDLVQQSADSVQQVSSVNIGRSPLSASCRRRARRHKATERSITVSGQVQALNDSLDEMKARIEPAGKSVRQHPWNDQQQTISAAGITEPVLRVHPAGASQTPATPPPPAAQCAAQSDGFPLPRQPFPD